MFCLLLRAIVKYMMSGKEVVRCPLCAVSDLVHEFSLDRIDFLKIDVERLELDVLRGIDPDDWPKIQNIVLEVHDIDDRLNVIVDMLKRFGIGNITTKESIMLENSGLWNVYAHR